VRIERTLPAQHLRTPRQLGGLVMPDLMAVAGHSTLQVTQRYLNTKADAAKRAASIQSGFYADFEDPSAHLGRR